MKKVVSLFLVFITVFVFAVPAFAAAPEADAVPLYTNAKTAKATLTINSSGVASMSLICTATSSTTSISCVSYLEKYTNGSWSRVDISASGDQWSDTVNSNVFSKLRTQQLNSSGRYRIVAIFTVRASTIETITLYHEATY